MNIRSTITMLGAALCAAPAWAQSGVTITGVMDAAVRQVHNQGVGSSWALVSGSNGTSRIAITGREDLGSGLAAAFHLEHGLLADTGAQASATKFWDRRATVMLASDRVGEIRAGRDLVPTYVLWLRYDPFAYIGAARSANLITATPLGPIRSTFGTNNNTTVRSDNAVQFVLPGGLGGLEGGLMVAPSEGGVVTTGAARLIGLRFGYTGKAFHVAAARTTAENSLTVASGKFSDTVVGGGTELAGVKLAAAWREFKVDTAKQSLVMATASWSTGPHEVKGSWIRSNMSGRVGTVSVAANDATQVGLGYVYSLSKRSALYTTAARISNKGASAFVVSDGPAGMAGGGTSRGVEFGIRHRF